MDLTVCCFDGVMLWIFGEGVMALLEFMYFPRGMGDAKQPGEVAQA
jgi:hypothetical protein